MARLLDIEAKIGLERIGCVVRYGGYHKTGTRRLIATYFDKSGHTVESVLMIDGGTVDYVAYKVILNSAEGYGYGRR